MTNKLAWYVNRLRAMSVPEVCWRLQQKRLQSKEKTAYGQREVPVISSLFDKRLENLRFNALSLGINFKNKVYSVNTDIHLLGGFSYSEYKKKWNAGFQTGNSWSNEFSYSLDYKQRDDIGDARTNWELNRHFQFALLAKAYYVTGDRKYFNELKDLFYDWNHANPFLHGISWTSVMEVAIRCIQWCITLAFLALRKELANEQMLIDIEIGIKNMALYISQHYSRFSSANNHLLVEATAMAFAGFAFNNDEWKQLAICILDKELVNQNYNDGVNKEMSLHYQTFGMEAYALVMNLMQKNGMPVPPAWRNMMENQCKFVVYSMVSGTKACEFGDNDEGKIIDLEDGYIYHYKYVLQLCSLALGNRYERFDRISETVRWLFNEKEIDLIQHIPYKAKATESMTFHNGGYTFLRSNDSKIVIGIDHAPLGFGSIAAHGHADALSFQLYVNGLCIIGDPGTFIYHCWIEKRNEYRSSRNHNTVWIDGDEQSQMLGAFLWGKKAETSIKKHCFEKEKDKLVAECKWQNGDVHSRSFTFKKGTNCLEINDRLQSSSQGFASFLVYPGCDITIQDNAVVIKKDEIQVKILNDVKPKLEDIFYSDQYGIETPTKKITYNLKNKQLHTTIWIEKY